LCGGNLELDLDRVRQTEGAKHETQQNPSYSLKKDKLTPILIYTIDLFTTSDIHIHISIQNDLDLQSSD